MSDDGGTTAGSGGYGWVDSEYGPVQAKMDAWGGLVTIPQYEDPQVVYGTGPYSHALSGATIPGSNLLSQQRGVYVYEGDDRGDVWHPGWGDPVNTRGGAINPYDAWSLYQDREGVIHLPVDPTPTAGKDEQHPPGYKWTRGFSPTLGGYETHWVAPTTGPFGMSDLGFAGLMTALILGGGLGAGLLLPGAAAGAAAAGAGAGATGGAGAAAGAAGAGAATAAAPSLLGVPLSTLSTIGTASGLAGTGANLLGAATGQDWLQKLGMGLGVAGGLAGGIGGLANVASTGVSSLADVARLASSAGKLTGVLGTLSDSDVLRQAGGYLGAAGGLAGGTSTLANLATSGVQSLSDAARLASGLGQVGSAVGRLSGNRSLQQASGLLNMGLRLSGGVQGLLGSAQQAQQQGTAAPVPRTMNDTDWLRWQR